MDNYQTRPGVQAYLDELAADIAEHGGLQGKTLMQAMQEAKARRQAFALEMAKGSTKRAKMARMAICASVWIGANTQKAIDRAIYQCEVTNHDQ